MNKQKFVEYLRSPENLSTSQFEEIEQLLVDYPYFSIAKSVAARASKTLDTPNKNHLISSAAIYATDRKHLKRYVNGEVIFLTDIPSVSSAEEKQASKPEQTSTKTISDSSKKDVEKPSLPEKMRAENSDVDQILDELHRDMEELKKSRLHFAEVQNLLPPDGSDIPRPPYKPKEDKPASVAPKEEAQVAKDDTKATNKTEPEKEEPKTPKEEHKAKSEKPKKEDKPTSSGNITSLIDSLKKEFEEEEEEQEPENKKDSPKEVESKKEEVSTQEVKEGAGESEIKTLEKAEAKTPEKEEEKKEEPKASTPEPPKKDPPKKTKPTVVTNMDDGDDEDEEDTVLDPNDKPVGEAPTKKTSAKASRGSRQKVKREDLERMMGIMSKPSSKKKEEPAPEEKKSEEEVKPKAKSLADIRAESLAAERADKEPPKEEKEEKEQEAEKPKKKTTTKSASKKKDEEKETKTKPKAKKTTKKKKEEKETEEPKETKAKEVEKKEEVKKAEAPSNKKEEETTPPITGDDDQPSRTSARAFLDFGGTGDMSASVSRASSSRRKRKRSPNSSNDSGEKKGGDDDDKSGPKDLIDKFIEENPSIQRRNLGSNKKDLSEDSSQWKPDIASEYLAEIYLNQGNKQRAVQIYEALILKFPEKKSYFAALIEKIQA